jgi:predicted transcriptional regulator
MQIILTDREAEFMESLWEHGPSTVAEVLERLPDDPVYTTVLNILRSLESKGYVRAVKEGRAHRYGPCISRTAARRSALERLLTRFYKGSKQLFITHLIGDEPLADAEIEHIKQLLTKHKSKSKTKKVR